MAEDNRVVGVRSRRARKVQYFAIGGLDVVAGDFVVVEGERGSELGWVVTPPQEAKEGQPKPISRLASSHDLGQAGRQHTRAKEAMKDAKATIARLRVPMKLLSAEYNLDGTRLTLHFSAEGRVDFRELVRELSSHFRTRIEMRQVGPRDETKLIGGIGQCGQVLCCTRWLSDFYPVSIRMAKEQELSLNPMKISGICGRLLCCLAYEVEQYQDMRRGLPRRGEPATVPQGVGVVVGGNPLKGTVMVELESGAVVEVPAAEVASPPSTAPSP